MRKPGREVTQLKFLISLKRGKNVGLGEWMIWQKIRSKYFIPMKFGGPPVEMAL